MKPTTLLTLLATATAAGTTSAATLPRRSLAPTRARDAAGPPQPRLKLLHTFPSAPPAGAANFRMLAAAAGDASAESTKGGAILDATEQPLTTVQGTLRIPAARMPTRGPTANISSIVYAASFWIGMDSGAGGAVDPSCGTGGPGGGGGPGGASLRAGVDVFWDELVGGAQTPFVWYQYSGGSGSGSAVGFEGFTVAEGDLVRFTLSSSQEEVVVLAENYGANVTCVKGVTPLQSVRQALPAPAEGSGPRLCGREAAWIVDDFPLENRPDVPVPLADFGTVTFGAAGVTLADGTQKDVTDAEVIDINLQAQGGRLTNCEVVDGKKVKCARVFGDE